MRKLSLIKHASPLVIPNVPPEKWRLSDKGKESCAPLAEAIRGHSPVVVVASEEPKARETAEIVAAKLGVAVETAPDLHEHDRSNVPHLRSGEFISMMELVFRKPDERVLGLETANEAAERFEAAVQRVLEKHPHGNVAIVTHGTVLALFVALHSERKAFELWREMGLPSFVVMSVPDLGVEAIVAKV